MRSASSPEEENIFSKSADKHLSAFLEDFGRDWKATLKEWSATLHANKYFMWGAVAFCTALFLLFWFGISILKGYARDIDYYIAHETAMSEQRAQMEIRKFALDSAMQVRQEEREIKKARDDSAKTAGYLKQLNYYQKLPDHKGE